MKMRTTVWSGICLLAIFSNGCSKKADDSVQEFNGKWRAVEITELGKPTGPDVLQRTTATFEEGKFLLATASKPGSLSFNKAEVPLNTFAESSIRVNRSKTPFEIDFVYLNTDLAGKERSGIFAWEGSRLKICVGNVGGNRPTEFTSTAESSLIILERQ